MQSFYSRFLESVEKFPSRVAVELQLAAPSTEVESHTYAELRHMAESVGAWLASTGAPRGARCAILGNNSPLWVAAYLGSLANGAVPVPLDTAFKPEQVATLLDDSGSSFLFADTKHVEIAQTALKKSRSADNIRLVLLDSELEEFPSVRRMIAAGADGFRPVTVDPEELAVLL